MSHSGTKKADQIRVGHLRALGRFFRDPTASKAGKIFVLATVAYVVSPIDLSPEVTCQPIAGSKTAISFLKDVQHLFR